MVMDLWIATLYGVVFISYRYLRLYTVLLVYDIIPRTLCN